MTGFVELIVGWFVGWCVCWMADLCAGGLVLLLTGYMINWLYGVMVGLWACCCAWLAGCLSDCIADSSYGWYLWLAGLVHG